MENMDVKIAKWAESEGYVIAGFSQELFEGAEFLYPPSYMGGDVPTGEELRFVVRGKVLEIVTKSYGADGWAGTNFVYVTEDGTQVSESYGDGLEIRFKDPEASK